MRSTLNSSVCHETLEFLAPKRAPEFAPEFHELGKWLGTKREYKLYVTRKTCAGTRRNFEAVFRDKSNVLAIPAQMATLRTINILGTEHVRRNPKTRFSGTNGPPSLDVRFCSARVVTKSGNAMYPKLKSPFQGPKCYPIPVDAEMLRSVWRLTGVPKMGTKAFGSFPGLLEARQQPQIMPD